MTLITAGTKQEIKSLAIKYEQGKASTPGDDCVEPQQKKRKSGQFYEYYTFLVYIYSHYDEIKELHLVYVPS